MLTLGLGALLVLALVLPFSVRRIEEELELFFLVMGVLAISLQGGWTWALAAEALREPLPITATVLCAGSIFRMLRLKLDASVRASQRILGPRLLAFGLVLGLGLLSSLITSVVAALVLSEVVSGLKLPKLAELRLVILGCFSIGAGSALTPLGGPLAAIAVSRLQGDPYHADFLFLARLLGPWVLPLMVLFGVLAAVLVQGDAKSPGLTEDRPESWRDIISRTLKIYGFVAGLVLFGRAFEPPAAQLLGSISSLALYWLNMLSAVLDNATLTAIEMGPQLAPARIRALLLGLLIAGGMLVPGNIPNIVCASKLRLSAGDWARFALPLGLATMLAVFGALIFS
jgi:predicted cation transporter